jgi:hypothetical protein
MHMERHWTTVLLTCILERSSRIVPQGTSPGDISLARESDRYSIIQYIDVNHQSLLTYWNKLYCPSCWKQGIREVLHRLVGQVYQRVLSMRFNSIPIPNLQDDRSSISASIRIFKLKYVKIKELTHLRMCWWSLSGSSNTLNRKRATSVVWTSLKRATEFFEPISWYKCFRVFLTWSGFLSAPRTYCQPDLAMSVTLGSRMQCFHLHISKHVFWTPWVYRRMLF